MIIIFWKIIIIPPPSDKVVDVESLDLMIPVGIILSFAIAPDTRYWQKCDGSAIKSSSKAYKLGLRNTPNLINRYMMGSDDYGTVINQSIQSHTHTINHGHTTQEHNHTINHSHTTQEHIHSINHGHITQGHTHSINHGHTTQPHKHFCGGPDYNSGDNYKGNGNSGFKNPTTEETVIVNNYYGNSGRGFEIIKNCEGNSGSTTVSVDSYNGNSGNITVNVNDFNGNSGSSGSTYTRPNSISVLYYMRIN